MFSKIISLSNIRPIIIYFHSSQCRLIPYLHQRPIFFKANSIHSSIVAILELIHGARRYGISRSCDKCVELDSRHPLLPKAGWGKWRFDSDLNRKKWKLFHIIRFKHIFHKRKSLYMLPKGKCICMLKRKFCVAIFWFLTIVILFVFVFFSYCGFCNKKLNI
jgi:hypothetical protein